MQAPPSSYKKGKLKMTIAKGTTPKVPAVKGLKRRMYGT
jgi:hypothetical protein